jgi:outer membrane biosynthesis protein TonB
VVSSRIVQSSGSDTLDEETLAMLVRAAAATEAARQCFEHRIVFVVPVKFYIK